MAADLASKHWVRANFSAGMTKPFLPGFLNLALTTNTGAAFGVGRDYAWLMTVLAVAILIAVLVWVAKRQKRFRKSHFIESLGAGLLIGGALGNICDRLVAGRVTDFLQFSSFDFPVFNLADVSIDIGVALILLQALLRHDTDSSCAGQEASPHN